jgi:CubicO group peptidase (beta-lactamase class C family)
MWLFLAGATAFLTAAAANAGGGSASLPARATPSDQCNRQVIRGELGRQIDQYLARAVPFGFSGSIFVVDSRGVLLHRAYGAANVARRIPNRVDTLFDMGSITKGFTATAIALLQAEGRLSLDQTLSVYFPDAPADKGGITIEQLLTHTAGLIDLTNPNDYLVISRDDFLRDLFNSPLVAAPGEKWAYSNAGYSVLAAIVEVVSGLPYEQFLRERILAPAGMPDTGYRLARWSNDRRTVPLTPIRRRSITGRRSVDFVPLAGRTGYFSATAE